NLALTRDHAGDILNPLRALNRFNDLRARREGCECQRPSSRHRAPPCACRRHPPKLSALRFLGKSQSTRRTWRLVVVRFHRSVGVICLLLAMALAANAQSVTGQISGNVADASGGALVGAVVRLTHDLSQQERSFTTASNGSFVFTNLVPGSYCLRISLAGFKNYEQKAISVSAQERVDLHEI